MSTHVIGDYSYFIIFIDDFSRYGHLYLMKYKSEEFEKSREYKNEVENQMERVSRLFYQIEELST